MRPRTKFGRSAIANSSNLSLSILLVRKSIEYDPIDLYAHQQTPSQKVLELASNLLSGNITDNTGGATHYYSPRSMPKKGAPTDGFDVGGGLERIAGRTTENYRPSFANSFKYVNVPDVREDYYKFYFAPGTGKVR